MKFSVRQWPDNGDGYDFMLFFEDCMQYILIIPRKAKIDAPGALNHVIVRGIERRKFFRSDYGRKNFLKRFGELITEPRRRRKIRNDQIVEFEGNIIEIALGNGAR